MRPFVQIAVPHEDILEGRLTMDVFAADLWQVATGRAPDEYKDPDLFFSKTYMTNGLRNILDIAESRLRGRASDAVIQLQTPFGGGKTHTLIALYHKAKEWGAKVAVFDGTALDPKDSRPWEEIERQLTGKVELTKGLTSPGKDKIMKILSENSPVLILMDEVLEYTTKAAGVRVENTTLSSQTLSFIQELTGAVSAIGNSLLVLTLPSSFLEHYDENAERTFHILQKIVGRTERIYTPVGDDEIEYVVKKRLFSSVDESQAKAVVNELVDHLKREGILSNEEAEDYRKRFLKSYPFKPDVIDVLYKRWGSFSTFQRTRGVLRLLSLVVHDLLEKNIPFIRLGDFNLENENIRRELVKHIGPEWDSIIAQDIRSGAKRVDEELGSSYKPFKLGTVVSTTIFMMSHSGKGKSETSLRDLKLSVAQVEISTSIIDTTVNKLRDRLFYLSDEGLFFTNRPNLNRMIISKQENVSDEEIKEEELNMLKAHISKNPKLKVHIFPKFSKDVPDNPEFKLVVLDKEKPDDDIFNMCGDIPRVYRNTIFFLGVDEDQRRSFWRYISRYIALKALDSDEKANLSEGQKKELRKKIEKHERGRYEELRKVFRKLFISSREGFLEKDLRPPTYGEKGFLDEEIYGYLKGEGALLEKVDPALILDKYMSDKDYLEIKNLYDAFLKTPGEIRPVSKDVFINSIKEGVERRIFGFGRLKSGIVECECIGKTPNVNMEDDEVIVKADLCAEKFEGKEDEGKEILLENGKSQVSTYVKRFEADEEEIEEVYSKLNLKLKVPSGKISSIARIVKFIYEKFENVQVEVSIKAENGEIRVSDYEDKIKETILQSDVEIEREDLS